MLLLSLMPITLLALGIALEAVFCLQAIRRLDQISNGIVALSAVLGTAAAFAISEAAEFSALGLPVQWRLMTGLIALAVLSLRGPVLSFRQRFFHADAIIG